MQKKIFVRSGFKIAKNRMMRNIVDYLRTKNVMKYSDVVGNLSAHKVNIWCYLAWCPLQLQIQSDKKLFQMKTISH